MTIYPLLVLLTMLAIPVGIITSIFIFVKASGEQDATLKKSAKKKAWWILLGPMVFMFLLVTVWGLIQAIINS